MPLSKISLRTQGVEPWDRFRVEYPNMTFEELKEFYRRIYEEYPNQKFYDLPFIISCLSRVQRELDREHLRIVELGGYNGELARDAFNALPGLGEWLNVDLLPIPQVFTDERYCLHVLEKPFTQTDISLRDFDVFVSGDTLEHFSNQEFKEIVKLLAASELPYLILKIPLSDPVTCNDDVIGAHLLTLGISEAKQILLEKFKLLSEAPGWCSLWKFTIERG